ncbi:GNAT family N-acetyltransferase [Actinoplanes sp. NPDC049599]|uniref:GNAT family N-acetyltransferase n=1 Tax=Actinoplanes sp. NPDC049599 TaxID=3363903 RepID=UPI0037A22313
MLEVPIAALDPATRLAGAGLHDSAVWLATNGPDVDAVQTMVIDAAPDGTGAHEGIYRARFRAGPTPATLHPVVLLGLPLAEAEQWEPTTVLGSLSGPVRTEFDDSRAAAVAGLVRAAAASAPGAVILPMMGHRAALALAPLVPHSTLVLGPVVSGHEALPVTETQYLRQLGPRKRALWRTEDRMLRDGGREIVEGRLTPDLVEDLIALQRQTQRRHLAPGGTRIVRARMLALLKSPLAPHTTIFRCLAGGALVGYAMTVEYGDTLHLLSIGLDYASIGRHAEYPHLISHAPVRHAIARGLRRVDLGIGGTHQKYVRGAVPQLTWTLLANSPPGWSAESARSISRARALATLAEVGRRLPPEQRAALASYENASPRLTGSD